jgi:hypothetical protein
MQQPQAEPAWWEQQVQTAREARLSLARRDPNTFIELVMRDEFNGNPVEQAPCHVAWHRALDEHRRVVLFAHIESGKTNQFSIGRTLWELGRNRNLRVALVSNTYHQAEKNVRAVAEYIERSEMLHGIFPELLPSEPWTNAYFNVQGDTIKRDPSVQAVGVHGNILGARLDWVILDDILDYENTLTSRQRQDLWDWYLATFAGRLTAHARVMCIGTAWHPDDIMHRWEREPAWFCMRSPVVDASGASTWPQRWPKDRIDAKRSELGPLEFARQMLCKARDDSESRFRQEWIDACLEKGDGLVHAGDVKDFFDLNEELRPPWWDDEDVDDDAREAAARLLVAGQEKPARHFEGKFVTGVDLAVQRHAAADETALFTLYQRPDGLRQVVEVQAGKWTGPEIVRRIVEVHQRFDSIVVVENNAAQDFVLQFVRAQQVTVPVLPFTTGKNKAHPEFGVESIAAEFAAGRWVIPSLNGRALHPQVDKWIQELLFYDPRAHTGDRLMACWFAREIARRSEQQLGGQVSARVVGV